MARKARNGAARPIKTRRDFAGASAVAKRISTETRRSADAEARLQSLLAALDRFDEVEEEEADADPPGEYDYAGPKRRWSDD